MAEMRRVLRPGGRLAVADLVCDPDPTIAATQNRLERLRDPSHTRMLALDELADLVGGTDVEFRDAERSLEPWLAQSRSAEEGRGRDPPRAAGRPRRRRADRVPPA